MYFMTRSYALTLKPVNAQFAKTPTAYILPFSLLPQSSTIPVSKEIQRLRNAMPLARVVMQYKGSCKSFDCSTRARTQVYFVFGEDPSGTNRRCPCIADFEARQLDAQSLILPQQTVQTDALKPPKNRPCIVNEVGSTNRDSRPSLVHHILKQTFTDKKSSGALLPEFATRNYGRGEQCCRIAGPEVNALPVHAELACTCTSHSTTFSLGPWQKSVL